MTRTLVELEAASPAIGGEPADSDHGPGRMLGDHDSDTVTATPSQAPRYSESETAGATGGARILQGPPGKPEGEGS